MDSSMSNSIPVMRKPTDAMSTGLNSSNLAASAMQRHPIDRMQRGEELLALVLMLVFVNIRCTQQNCMNI